jgi:hypothetical protein
MDVLSPSILNFGQERLVPFLKISIQYVSAALYFTNWSVPLHTTKTNGPGFSSIFVQVMGPIEPMEKHVTVMTPAPLWLWAS